MNQAEQSTRIEKLEVIVEQDAKTIANLRHAVIEQHDRIGRLEAVLAATAKAYRKGTGEYTAASGFVDDGS